MEPRERVIQEFLFVRQRTEALTAPLQTEDFVVQSMPDVSPTKWHLAHTSWFFETFVLRPTDKGYSPFDGRFSFFFNSYYEGVGDFLARDRRGSLSRPTVKETLDYRIYVTHSIIELLREIPGDVFERVLPAVTLGIQHEEQHQELLLTDIKHVFFSNPLRPRYCSESVPSELGSVSPMQWIPFQGGKREFGAAHDACFAFDNERPSHTVWLEDFRLGSRLVTNQEYLEFINDGGYENPSVWLSNGWVTSKEQGWKCPLYWEPDGDRWMTYSLAGTRELSMVEPVCHVSFYEADAFARWSGNRLPTEFEWEVAARLEPVEGNLLAKGRFHPVSAPGDPGLQQIFGDVWEWTASPYLAYPGFRPFDGDMAEYNGKFMCDQWVLRGGSCVTPQDHIRATYRNFFPADARWQFSGIRLAT